MLTWDYNTQEKIGLDYEDGEFVFVQLFSCFKRYERTGCASRAAALRQNFDNYIHKEAIKKVCSYLKMLAQLVR